MTRSTHLSKRHVRWLSALLPTLLASVGTTVVLPTQATQAAQAAPTLSAAVHVQPTAMAKAAAQARSTGRSVDVAGLTTPTTRTLANPDGTVTLELNSQPVRVQHNGAWTALDATLARNADGTWSPKATPGGLTLSGGGEAPLASMTNEGTSLALSWPGRLPAPLVSGATATYRNIRPGVDLTVTANTGGGFSHVLVVHNAAAAAMVTQVRLPISAKGLRLAADESGNLTATDALGEVRFAAPTPTMWDSGTASELPAAAKADAARAVVTGVAPAASSARGPGVAAKVDRLAVTADQHAITLTPPVGSLTGAAVRYPLYLDPTWNSVAKTKSAWTFVNSYYHGSSYYNSTDWARVGYQGWDSPYYKGRSFFKFAIPSAIWNQRIDSAILQTKMVWSATNAAFDVSVHHISNASSAIGSGTTWDNQPAKGGLIVTKQTPGNWRADGSELPVPVEFDVKSEIVSAAAGRWSYATIGLYNETETDRDGWRKFENNPTLAIKYNSAPATPTSYMTQPATQCPAAAGSMVGNTAVTFNAKVTDPDGTNNPLATTFTITDITAEPDVVTTLTQSVSSGSTATLTQPASFFIDAHTYTWSVKTSDGFDTSPSTPTCQFGVLKTAPGAPTVTSTDFPPSGVNGRAGETGAFTFTSAGGSTPVAYVWGVNVAPPVTATGPIVPQSGWGKTTASGGTASIQLNINRVGPNILYVYAIDAANNASAVFPYAFTADPRATPNPYGDFTGDGQPDVLLVGDATNPGLWLYAGSDNAGHVSAIGVQVGGRGTGFAGGIGGPGDWIGTSVSPGDFNGDGAQDILVRFPTANLSGSNTQIILGTGDGTPFDVTDATRVIPLNLPNTDDQNANYQTVGQMVAVPDNLYDRDALAAPYLTDLLAVVGDDLYVYPPSGFSAGMVDLPTLVSSGWTGKTLSATTCADECPAFFARTDTTGALDRWQGTAFNTTTGVPGIVAGEAASTRFPISAGGFLASNAPVIIGADIDVDGNADLWNTWGSSLEAHFYLDNTNFKPTIVNAGITRGAMLVADYEFGERAGALANDATSNQHTATLTGGAAFTAIGHNATDGGALSVNGTTGRLKTAGPVLRTDQSFTVAAWVKPATTTGYQTIVCQAGVVECGALLQYVPNLGWAITNQMTDSTAPTVQRTTSGMAWVSTANWQHVVGVYDAIAHTQTLYVNGTQVGQLTGVNVSWNATGKLMIGNEWHSSAEISYFNGGIDDVQIFQGVVTAAQIKMMANPNPRPHDFNNDGHPDLITSDSAGDLWLYPSTGSIGTSLFGTRLKIGSGWGGHRWDVSDWNRDGWTDIITVEPTLGELYLYPNTNGTLSTSTRSRIGVDWSTVYHTTGNGDSNPQPDHYGIRASDGQMFHYPNGCCRVSIKSSGYTNWRIFGADFDSDGRGDILAVNPSNSDMTLMRHTGGTGLSMLGTPTAVGNFAGYSRLTVFDLNEDGKPDVVGVNASGVMYLFPGTGTGTIGTAVQIGSGFTTTVAGRIG
ncbi:LamG-like jellyroll fold domain-containing protein [Catellatospora tritici]|uniref:LamG-like jellyroll fold domain-containing protein n=1 Tax=Catellatospora tritici TaxID=2851566 RepID=UPI001C2DEE6B|nr:LamG-like jellyroll fold domain-containing protein [Catellatospora tritici]MBV1855187.1 VCBS repeat-containing protein [Catellatospora tritici]